MTIRIIEFDPHTASDELWAAFNETRRAIAHELWPDEPILDDAETRREVQTTNPMVEFRRWVAIEGDEVAGSIRAAFRRPGTPDEKDHARFLWAGGGVRAGSRRRGAGTLLLREVHQLMHALDKTLLTMNAQTEPGHAFIKHVGAVEKHCTVEQHAIFADLDWLVLWQWEDGVTAQGLAWERYAGRVPRDVLVALLPVFTELFADVPLGGLETGPIRWEMSGYDLWYKTLERVGGRCRCRLTMVGSPVGSPDAACPRGGGPLVPSGAWIQSAGPAVRAARPPLRRSNYPPDHRPERGFLVPFRPCHCKLCHCGCVSAARPA